MAITGMGMTLNVFFPNNIAMIVLYIRCMRQRKPILLFALIAILASSLPAARACTIFILTDSSHTLFCNNEDWEDPNTIIWFVPAAGDGTYGCAFVGFANQWGQGGLNTEGLAYDWVAGFQTTWEREANRHLEKVSGNPAEKMLRSCATVDEAIAFFATSWEPGFAYAMILIADSSGKSAIIGAKDNKMVVYESARSRGFGYGIGQIEEQLATQPEVTLQTAGAMLKKASQQGQYATRYANVFDLNSGDIYLLLPDQPTPVQLNICTELDKGAHYYDIPNVAQQIDKEIKTIRRWKEWVKKLYMMF
jgi:hypothetical protein